MREQAHVSSKWQSTLRSAVLEVGLVPPSNEGRFEGHLDLRQVGEETWMLLEPLRYVAPDPSRSDTVPSGSTTDLASVPQWLTWLVPRYGDYTKAAVLHDHQRGKSAHRGEDRPGLEWALAGIEADLTFREVMQAERVPWLRRWLMWSAVTWATAWDRRKWLCLAMAAGVVAIVFTLAWLSIEGAQAVGQLVWSDDFMAGWTPVARAVGVGVVVAFPVSLLCGLVASWPRRVLVLRLFPCVALTAFGLPFLLMGLLTAATLAVERVAERVVERALGQVVDRR